MGRPTKLKETVPGLWHILRYFWPWIRKRRPLIAGSLTALFVATGLRLLEPWPLKFIIDRFVRIDQPEGATGPTAIESLDTMTLLTISAVAVVVITGLRAVFEYYSKVGFARVGNRVLRDIRNDVYRHLQRLSLAFHSKARSGDLIVRVTRDVGMLRDVTGTAILPLIASTVILMGMAAVMFWMHWRLAFVAFATIPLFWISTVQISRRIHQVARKQRRQEGAMAATAAESINAIKIVQALSLEGVFADDFCSQNEQSQKEDLKAAKYAAKLSRTVDVLIAIGTALVLWFGARSVLRGQMTPGDLLVFLTYLKRAFHPARDFAKYSARLAKATAAGERVLELLERTPDVRDLPHATPAPNLQGTVTFADVTFGYEPGHCVLDRINIEVPAGRHVALTGPSGIGKSTFVSLILRLYDPVKGRVLIDGHDIRDYTIASLRSQISVVLQDSVLFATSVWDNIAYGAPDSTRDEIEEAARLANAHEFIEALPEGFDTILGERGATLSHGQRQRIAIARAAIRQTPILILDEPTTGLDEENERAVVQALTRLAAGRTTFFIAHDLELVAGADRILYLDGGRIVEQGTHAELIQAKGTYARLHNLQTATGDRLTPEVLIP